MDSEIDFVVTQTDDIVISACQAFLEGEEESACGYYLRIENNSTDRIQILGKDFNFTDDRGNNFCDNGTGFKGELPELEPGEYFEYADEAPLRAAEGVLYGSFRIVKEKQSQVKDIKIPAVTLKGNSDYKCSVN